jgi:predicted RecB family nuclease
MQSPYPLPRHFAREQTVLQQAGVDSWQRLAALSDADLRQLASRGGALERQLRKLRGQAQLVSELGLEPAEAALLLYAGIASTRGLAQASPQQLLTQLGRLERSLTGMAPPRVDASWVRHWILVAQRRLAEPDRGSAGRSGN